MMETGNGRPGKGRGLLLCEISVVGYMDEYQ